MKTIGQRSVDDYLGNSFVGFFQPFHCRLYSVGDDCKNLKNTTGNIFSRNARKSPSPHYRRCQKRHGLPNLCHG
jgi:hypothetical protein